MRRSLVFAVLTLGLLGCGPGANRQSGVLPQADTPPDPPASAVTQSAAAADPPPSSGTNAG